MLVSFVYLVACRLFALVLLLTRSDGSKDSSCSFCATNCRSCGGRRGARS